MDDEDDTPFSGLSALSHEQENALRVFFSRFDVIDTLFCCWQTEHS